MLGVRVFDERGGLMQRGVIAPYHRLGRARPGWWRPLLEISVAVVVFCVLQLLWVCCFLFGPLSGIEPRDLLAGFSTDPAVNLFTFGAIALGVPSTLVAARVAGKPRGVLWSVAGRFRMKLLGEAFALIALPVVVLYLVMFVVNGAPLVTNTAFWQHLAIVVALVPLQCLAEELFFRGTLPQAMGMWERPAWVAYLVPLPIFVLGHPYNIAGLVSVGIFAALASLLTHRTGGLEAAFITHTTMNISVYCSELADGPSLLATSLAMYTGVAILLVLHSETAILPPRIADITIRSLPYPTGDLLRPLGITLLGPENIVLNNFAWRGDPVTAELEHQGLRYRYTALHGHFTLSCRNMSPTARPVSLTLVPHWAVDASDARVERDYPGLLLVDATRTTSLTFSGANDMVVWSPDADTMCVGPAVYLPAIAPKQTVKLEMEVRVL